LAWMATIALAAPPPGRVVVARFGPEAGLPSAQVRALALGPDGLLYVGGEGGVCRFDGARCEAVPLIPGEEPLTQRLVNVGGVVYAQTRAGLWQIAPGTPKQLTTQGEARANASISPAAAGGLWVATGVELLRVQGGAVVERRDTFGVEPWAVLEQAGSLYLGSPDGAWTLGDEGVTPLANLGVRAFLEDGEGLLVAREDGVWRLLHGAWTLVRGDCYATDLTRRPDGRAVASCGSGLVWEEASGEWSLATPKEGLPASILTRALVDQDGLIWAGTLEHGLLRIDQTDLRLWDDATGINLRHVTSLLPYKGGLMVGTRGGLGWVSPEGVLQPLRLNDEVLEVRHLASAPDGAVLILRGREGVLRWDGEELTELLALDEDATWVGARPNGEVVVLTDRAMVRAHHGVVHRVELPGRALEHLAALDEAGAVYVIIEDKLIRVHDEGVTVVAQSPGRCSYAPLAMRGGRLYAGCGDTFYLLDGASWRAVQPLEAGSISSMESLGETLWVTTTSALIQLGPSPRRLSIDDGLPFLSFVLGGPITRVGDWIVASTDSGLLFLRDAPRLAPRPLVARVASLHVGDRRLPGWEALGPDDTLLRLRLGVDSVIDPRRVRYRFRLDDGDWSAEFSEDLLHLPGLSPGAHRLELQARLGGGPTGETTTIRFTLPPRWHQRRDVQALAALSLALLLAFTWRERTRRLTEELRRLTEREAFREVFGRFVTPQVADEALAGRLSRQGERREVTILIADLQGFTSLAERLDPRDLVALLNHWLTEMVTEIEAEGGMVNKFVGDEIVAIFGAPLPQPDHADRALAAAARMLAAGERLRASLRRPDGVELRFGVGLNSGEVIAGCVGAERRLEYTVIGDTVNVAARVQALTRGLGRPVLITEATRARLTAPANLSPEGEHSLRGHRQNIVLWSLSDPGAA
jgi:class 3 adenylate cyclase